MYKKKRIDEVRNNIPYTIGNRREQRRVEEREGSSRKGKGKEKGKEEMKSKRHHTRSIRIERQWNLPWCCKWPTSFSLRCSICLYWRAADCHILSRRISSHRRSFCCNRSWDPICPSHRAPPSVGCP